jgi:hypothetical protein
MRRDGVFCWAWEHNGHCGRGVRATIITTQMNHNQQQKLVPVESTTRTLSEKTGGEQTPKGPAALIGFDEMVRRVTMFFDDFTDAFKQAMKAHGMEIGNMRILWRPADLRLRETLTAARLVPEVKVSVTNENELPG